MKKNKNIWLILICFLCIISCEKNNDVNPETKADFLKTAKNGISSNLPKDKTYRILWDRVHVDENFIEVPYLENEMLAIPRLKNSEENGRRNLMIINQNNTKTYNFINYYPFDNFKQSMAKINFSQIDNLKFSGIIVIENIKTKNAKYMEYYDGALVKQSSVKRLTNAKNAKPNGQECQAIFDITYKYDACSQENVEVYKLIGVECWFVPDPEEDPCKIDPTQCPMDPCQLNPESCQEPGMPPSNVGGSGDPGLPPPASNPVQYPGKGGPNPPNDPTPINPDPIPDPGLSEEEKECKNQFDNIHALTDGNGEFLNSIVMDESGLNREVTYSWKARNTSAYSFIVYDTSQETKCSCPDSEWQFESVVHKTIEPEKNFEAILCPFLKLDLYRSHVKQIEVGKFNYIIDLDIHAEYSFIHKKVPIQTQIANSNHICAIRIKQ